MLDLNPSLGGGQVGDDDGGGEEGRIEVLQRLCSASSQRAGMSDQFSLGYLGFALGPDQRTAYYLTGGPACDPKTGQTFVMLCYVMFM